MTVSSEAKRTLVKSPPELWDEVSDAASLARHLGGIQEIRITRAEPETAVEWEADGASGSVRLQPSGFGTKVTLSLSRELATPPAERAAVVPEPASEPVPQPQDLVEPQHVVEPQHLVEPQHVVEPQRVAEPELEPEQVAKPEHVADAEPDPAASEPAVAQTQTELSESPREGFFARLFKRRRKPTVSAGESIGAPHEPAPVALAQPEPPEPAPVALAQPEPHEPAPVALDRAEPHEPAPVVEPERAPLVEPAPAALAPEPAATSSPEALSKPHAVPAEGAPPDSEPEPGPIQPGRSVTADLAMLEGEMAERDEAMLTAMLDRLGAAHHRPFSRS